ncbi:MAG: HAMP domain-containing sensor histidine kinase [Acidobacteria bacterium]|nr:HAMP domain-containing sensor histidine kinase [Acidobacteriota bacterium]
MVVTGSRWRRIVGLAGAAALAVAAGGWLIDRARFGPPPEAGERIERQVQERFAAIAATLRRMAVDLAAAPGVEPALAGDRAALSGLFERARTAAAAPTTALTVYDADGAALAWAGRPSEIPRARLLEGRAFFTAAGPLGLRLIYVEPIAALADRLEETGGWPRGAVAAEWVLSSPAGLDAGTDSFRLDGWTPTVRLRSAGGGGAQPPAPDAFRVHSPEGGVLLLAEVTDADVAAARAGWRRTVRSLALGLAGAILLLAAIPELARSPGRAPGGVVARGVGAAGLTLAIGAAASWTAATPGADRWRLFSPDVYVSAAAGNLLRSPADLLLCTLVLTVLSAAAMRLVGISRVAWRRRRASAPVALLARLGGGAVAAALVAAYQLVLHDTVRGTVVDVLRPSLQPLDSGRFGMLLGMVLGAVATVWLAVAVLLLVEARWGRRLPSRVLRVLGCVVPGAALLAATDLPAGPFATLLAGCAGAALLAAPMRPSLRHASQTGRMLLLLAAYLGPALLAYPSVLHYGTAAKRELIEGEYALQAAGQPQALRASLALALEQIDGVAGAELRGPGGDASAAGGSRRERAARRPDPDRAFRLWRRTELARRRLTSAVELYGADGSLLSRFALNIPDYAAPDRGFLGTTCSWDVFGEVLPFGSRERKHLHAERAICAPAGDGGAGARPDVRGSIVVHVALDYEPRPFGASRGTYAALLGADRAAARRGQGQDVELATYGWDLSLLYASGAAVWTLDDALFARIYASRDPFWTRRTSAGRDYHVYVVNNRVGIFALGYPVSTPGDHVVRLAEIAALGGLGFLGWMGVLLCAGPLARAGHGFGRDLLREVRTSFYRRLFLAFVAVAVIPVLALAFVIRNYVTGQLRRDVEAGAARTAAVAQRVVEELQQPADRPLAVIDDDALVFVSQVIDQDISIFEGPRLAATSERDLFASGLLPTRTPDAVYEAIVLGQAPAFVAEDAVGSPSHLLAATPIRSAGSNAILTVPLASREQEIERQIAELDRGIVLGVTLLILLGAGSGFYLAERIADPVKRLTRATQRIARGDFDAQVVARAADEFGRLVAAFNGMAEDLKQQRERLERTHRLEAWAEMARQVAHEIKNPLTPVQLSAEHLLRVHADRGEPLSPVLESCVSSILQQVHLLRRIASEFSSFAGSPRVTPEPTSLDRLVAGVLDPYRIGLDDRIRLAVDVPATLPALSVDPTLVTRAITNVVENALHAMPGGGVLALEASADDAWVELAIRDTGVGLDGKALARIFEPYFSTRASGTGLGMAIAKRNVELNGGSVHVASRRGEGTTVTLRLPLPPPGSP